MVKTNNPWGRLPDIGTPALQELAQAVSMRENATSTRLTPSGHDAITTSVTACLEELDEGEKHHILVCNNLYGGAHGFFNRSLKRWGVETTYFPVNSDPNHVEGLIRENTRLILFLAPSDNLFDVPDTQGLCQVARQNGVVSIVDGTWGGSLFYKPLDLGADISAQSRFLPPLHKSF